MEPRNDISKWSGRIPPLTSVEDYYKFGRNFVAECYETEYEYIRNIKFDEVGPDHFWREYIWCVYVSGFSSKVVARIHPDLMKAYGSYDYNVLHDTWNLVSKINRNRAKFNAIIKTAQLINFLGWHTFKSKYLCNADDIKQLGFMGPVTSMHLARNIGLDAVKPDLHLVRLSNHFGFGDPFQMCELLSGLSGERVGLVDLVLFYTASTFGTIALKKPGDR